jgi:hypothetical protein
MRPKSVNSLVATPRPGVVTLAVIAVAALAACSNPTAERSRASGAAAPVATPAPAPVATPAVAPVATPAPGDAAAQAAATTPPTAPQGAPVAPPPPAAPTAPVDIDPVLKARVEAYWAARMKLNLLAAYPFYDATFRAAYSEEKFLQNFQRLLRFRPEYLGIDRVTLTPSKTVAVVGVRLRTRPSELDGMELVSVSEEKWQKNGDTWFKQGEPLMPDLGGR